MARLARLPHPPASNYFVVLRLLLVVAVVALDWAGWPWWMGVALGAGVLGARRLQLDLRTEQAERRDGLAGATPAPRLGRALARVAQRHGIQVPAIYLIDEPSLGAAVCGARQADQAILVGRELARALSGRALLAMLAHELAHTHYRDVALGIALRSLMVALGGALIALLAVAGPLGAALGLLLALLLRGVNRAFNLRVGRLLERRADRFAVRVVGASALVRALQTSNRRERAQLALSRALERAGETDGFSERRIDRASGVLLDLQASTHRLIQVERRLTRDLPAAAKAEIRALRRRDPWSAGGVYGTMRERIGRIRAESAR